MKAKERREEILRLLRTSGGPVSASALAGRFGVSRQVVVGDVALLRAEGEDVAATPKGYVLPSVPAGIRRQVACQHDGEEMERELNAIVDQGCTVLDVIVEHPVYGQLTGALRLSCRYDVSRFLEQSANAHPLSELTEGIHLHTLICPDEEAYERVCASLDELGFLLKGSPD